VTEDPAETAPETVTVTVTVTVAVAVAATVSVAESVAELPDRLYLGTAPRKLVTRSVAEAPGWRGASRSRDDYC